MSEMKSLTLNDKTYDGFVDPVARALGAASAVVLSAAGESITLADSSGNQLYGLNIYGRTIQDGVPFPDAPVELESVGDNGGVTVTIAGKKDSQDIFIETPNGLAGIPVSTGGNYTDENGQQWVCDEIDFASGEYVQRIAQKTIDSSVVLVRQSPEHTVVLNVYTDCRAWGVSSKYAQEDLFCTIADHGAAGSTNNVKANICRFNGGFSNFLFDVPLTEYPTIDAVIAYVAQNPFRVYYILETPVKTQLSEEEIAAYNILRTYRDGTTITNDASAYMEMEYAMDTRRYIDNLIFASGGTLARLTEITLQASKWTGSGNLYSQVVSIPGITENSQVNLTPTVTQMATFYEKDISFTTLNEDGVVTVYVIGQKPVNDYVIPASIVEVRV